jgi:2-C-methyl-D-erythritol 4-phosphate cytidylyltransferase
MKEYVIIVAGGSGSRMKSDIPKQFIPVNGLPILMHTIQAFERYSSEISIILVLPKTQFSFWNNLCTQYQFHPSYQLVAGGETRFHSVQNGLNHIQDENAIVAVHDGVRPVITTHTIQQGFLMAQQKGTAITSMPVKDSIRRIESNGDNKAVDRSAYRLIQTPQTFRIDWMRAAFSHPYQDLFTDCASVLESAGYPIHLIEGSYENIKITTPEDLQWASVFLGKE